jgi:N-acetylglucosaminyl-diphospho-decaprenol L-rhamnosyltransferase
MTDLSIIIVNWNSVDYLQACLSSLYRETQGLRFEVIVVDNASGDGCKSMLCKDFHDVQLIEARENLGFARANNLGSRRSKGDLLLFLNPDTEVIGDALVRMVAYLRTHPSAGAAGVRLLNSDGSVQTSCIQPFPSILNQMLDFEYLQRRFPRWKLWGMQPLFDPECQAARVDTISGACFMVKRSVFNKVGGFSEEYFMYSDDLDLSRKIAEAGYEVVCLPGSAVTHHGGKSSVQRTDSFADVLQRESLEQFFRKTQGRFYATAYRLAMAAIAIIRMTAAVCLAPFAGRVLQGKKPGAVFRKWSAILGWALGLRTRSPSQPGSCGSLAPASEQWPQP